MSGWIGWPLTAESDITDYNLMIQPWLAMRRRHKAIGELYWPQPDYVWDSGTTTDATQVSGSTDITLSMPSTGMWVTYSAGGCSDKRWVSYSCTDCNLGFLPRGYDVIVIVDDDDPRTHIRGHIVDQTGGDTVGDDSTLVIAGINCLNAIAAGYITSISDLAGKPYLIQRQNGNGMHDRWPTQPDDQQIWKGSGTATTGTFVTGGTTYKKLVDDDTKTSWATDVYAGKQLLIFAGSLLRRITIVHNDSNSIYVANDSDATDINGTYAVVATGAVCTPGKGSWLPWQWYSGAGGSGAAGHSADDDTVISVAGIKPSITYNSGNPCHAECEDFTDGLFDKNPTADVQDICAGSLAGAYLNASLYKSYHGLQIDILDICSNFIPMRSDNYESASAIPVYTPAQLFSDCGINSGTSSIDYNTYTDDDVEHHYFSFGVADAYKTKNVYYTIIAKNGDTKTFGYLPVGSDGQVINVDGLSYVDDDNNDIGLKVVYSAGWTRIRPRWFKYHYPKTVFIPAPKGEEEGGGVYDPPEAIENDDGGYDCSAVGNWITRPASAGGIVVSDTGEVVDSAEPFVTNGLYRCIGDNRSDPFPGGPYIGDGSELTPYENRFYRGNLAKNNQSNWDASKVFLVSRSDYFSVSQTDHDWHSDWANSGTLRTQNFIASGGSTIAFTDNSKDITDADKEDSCWLASDSGRYAADAYVGFILQVDKTRTLPNPDEDAIALDPTSTVTQTVTFKVPITGVSYSGGHPTFTFNAFQIPKYHSADQSWTWEDFTVVEHDVGRIVEPKYEINKWKGRKVSFTTPDKTTLDDIVITYSDGGTLYFDAQDAPVPIGSAGKILEKKMGVFRWNGTEMIPAEGSDSTRLTVQTANDFKEDINDNNESWVKDYGPVHYGDMFHIVWLNQIYATINKLGWTKGPLAWTNKESGDDTEGLKNKFASSANLPFWTEDPTFWSYIVANNPEGLDIHESAYDSSTDAWKRCWSAVFDFTDSWNADKYLHDSDPSYDGLTKDDGISPRQCGGYSNPYCYVDHWEYPGYYYGGCNYKIYYDATVFSAFIDMISAEAYGKVGHQIGFEHLDATIVGMTYCGISPTDPPQADWTEDNPIADYCTDFGRWGATANQFQASGSGAQYHKWHAYSTWAAETEGTVYGPLYGSTSALGEPDVKFHKCTPVDCTYTDPDGVEQPYKPFESNIDGGDLGWCVIDQMSIIKWDMEGY